MSCAIVTTARSPNTRLSCGREAACHRTGVSFKRLFCGSSPLAKPQVPDGALASERRTSFAARMPEGNYFEKRLADPVVEEVPNAREVQPSNDVGSRCFDLGANAGFFNEQGQGGLNILAHSSRSCESIGGPPLCRSFDLALCARLDSDTDRQAQPKRRSRAKNSSAGMPSSRSASSRAASRSASSWGGSFTTASSPRARTVTAVPSGRDRPSTTTLPPTTVPEATCISGWYLAACGGCNIRLFVCTPLLRPLPLGSSNTLMAGTPRRVRPRRPRRPRSD